MGLLCIIPLCPKHVPWQMAGLLTLASTFSRSLSFSTTWYPSVSWSHWRLSNSSKPFSSTGWVKATLTTFCYIIFQLEPFFFLPHTYSENYTLYVLTLYFVLLQAVTIKKKISKFGRSGGADVREGKPVIGRSQVWKSLVGKVKHPCLPPPQNLTPLWDLQLYVCLLMD